MGMRVPFIAGNWKMHKTASEAEAHIESLLPQVSDVHGVDVALCVPFTDLHVMVGSAAGSNVAIYAQNMHEEQAGAFTGEISPPMLAEIGIDGVLLGHSERRRLFGETDRALAAKVSAALDAGLRPILCVGETEAEREAQETERRLRHQVREGLSRVPSHRLADVVIAYEPIWAIGTGNVASAQQAQEAISFIRALLSDKAVAPSGGPDVAPTVRILYGGSVTAGNASELLRLEDVDGVLVGGASLDADEFSAIVAAAVGTPEA